MGAKGWGLVLAGLGTWACGADGKADSAASSCLSSALESSDASASDGADGGAEQEPDRAAIARDACLAAGLPGTDCDPARFITESQARCIVQAENPPAGTGEWRVSLVFASEVTKRIVWDVGITLGQGRTQHYAVDAITGDVLRRNVTQSVD